MTGGERRRASEHIAPRKARCQRHQRVELAPLQLVYDPRAVVVQRASAPWTDFFRLAQGRFELPEQLAHQVSLPGGPGRWSRARGQVMRDGHKEQQAEPLAVANARGQFEDQVLVVEVATGGRIGEQSIVADDEAERFARIFGQFESAAHGQRGLGAELVQQYAEIEPVASAERAPGPLGEWVARFRPFVQSAQGQKAVAIEGQIVRARWAWMTPDGHQLREI